MNRNKLKAYAPNARRDFIKAVTDRAAFYGLTKDIIEPITEKGDVAIIAGKPFPRAVTEKRKKLEDRIKQQGFDQVMEAMAYTWFNRFVAIRYMELHGYLDHGYRVLSTTNDTNSKNSKSMEAVVPDILKHAEHVDLPGLNQDDVIELKMAGDKDDVLYRMLLIAQCNALHKAMPFLFEWVDNETELLLPENLLHSDSVIRKMVHEVPEDEWQEVEIIGWLYQFYISERKDEVFAGLKKNKKITPENIPAATQLFTPNWIVRYLVENSLGRLWMLNRPHSGLINKMDYYIKPEDQETDFLKINSPEEIKICDPACGSGHMLVYAFDLLYAIYEEQGYKSSEIPQKILENNLYGIEIDERAGALSAFALAMKAREKDRRFFQKKNANGKQAEPNICVLQNVRLEDSALSEYLDFVGRDLFTSPLQTTLRQFEETKNFGSLIQPDVKDVAGMLKILEAKDVSGHLFLSPTHEKVLRVLQQADYLNPKYHVVIANPPYMGGGGMNGRLKAWVKDNYPASKADLFTMFMERALALTVKKGVMAMINMQSWMFLSAYENLRSRLISQASFLSMAHFGERAFDTVGGAVVSTTAFVMENAANRSKESVYIRLVDGENELSKSTLLKDAAGRFQSELRFSATTEDFAKIPGNLIAYWLTHRLANNFEELPRLGEIFTSREGLTTGSNDTFLRQWFEVSLSCSVFPEDTQKIGRWFAYLKGGEYRRWAGNNEHFVDWENEGERILNFIDPKTQRVRSHNYNGEWAHKPGITWSSVSGERFSVRDVAGGYMFDTTGSMGFVNPDSDRLGVVAYLNSSVAAAYMKVLSPAIRFQPGHALNLPFDKRPTSKAHNIAGRCIVLSQSDWDAYESSWDFTSLPLLQPDYRRPTLKGTYHAVRAHWQEITLEMQRLEAENNRIFIEAYGLQDELTPDVPLNEITLTCNPHYRYGNEKSENDLEELLLTDTIKELLSYAIGCMMGRYSLDKPGLIYAHSGNRDFDPAQYRTLPVDSDGIIPITDIDWFEDDAANRMVEFLNVAWPKEHLEENLKFVAESIGQKRGESPRDTIRRYLATGYYKHHLSIYKKRPIYWLFSSGKQQAFQCLVYLHRYNEGTLSRMRTEYVIPLQGKINARIEQLKDDINAASSTAHRKKLEKEQAKLVKQREELQAFDEKLRHYADQRISLNLDDGVKVNYGKFGDLLAEVKAVTGKKPE